ncbi:hypothetical protein [Bradyrhizobium sp. USDA 3315]
MRSYVGIDVANLKNAIAIAETSRGGEVRFFREVDASATGMRRAFKRIASRLVGVHLCARLVRLATGFIA